MRQPPDRPTSRLRVLHEPDRHRFVIRLPDGLGELLYQRVTPEVLDLYHAEVSQPLRGRGIAAQLVQAAAAAARSQGWRVIPSCPYVAAWFRRHPDEQDLLVRSF